MLAGLLFGLGACFIWGTVYVAPLVLGDVNPVLIAFCRYAVFGLFCIVLALPKRHSLRTLSRRDWIIAAALGIVGNLIYYWVLSEAVVRVGAAVAGACSALIPFTATFCANLSAKQPLPWRKLLFPLSLIFIGLLLLNSAEFERLRSIHFFSADADFYWGLALAFLSVAIWTWYPLTNASWLSNHKGFSAADWVIAQGLWLGPISIVPILIFPNSAWPAGGIDAEFVFWILFLGIVSSWVGNCLWNAMSRRLPSLLIGQMLIFETLSAVAYSCIYHHSLLEPEAFAGVALMLAGISLSVFRIGHVSAGNTKPQPQKGF